MSNASNAVLALCRAFYGKRISDIEYDTLSGCRSLSEFVSNMRSTELYSTSFHNAHPNTLSIESAIDSSSFERFEKIFRYERAIGDRFYEYFIVRKEIDEILKITLMVFAGTPEKYIVDMSPYSAKKASFDLFGFARVKDFNDVLFILAGTRYEKLYSNILNEVDLTYLKFENAFESYFDDYLSKLIKKCFSGGERKEIIDIITRKRDLQLILRRIRICRFYPYMFDSDVKITDDYPFSEFTGKQISTLYSARSEAALREFIKGTVYKNEAYAEDLEKALYKNLYGYIKKVFRYSSHPGAVTYCYLFLAENEAKNLKRITEGIKYDIPREEIRNQLCI